MSSYNEAIRQFTFELKYDNTIFICYENAFDAHKRRLPAKAELRITVEKLANNKILVAISLTDSPASRNWVFLDSQNEHLWDCTKPDTWNNFRRQAFHALHNTLTIPPCLLGPPPPGYNSQQDYPDDSDDSEAFSDDSLGNPA